MYFGDAGVGPNLNVLGLLNLVDEVLRHSGREPVSTHQDYYSFGILGEIDCGLSRGIRAAHHIHHFTFTGDGLSRTTAVVHPRTLELVYPRSFQPTPLHAGSDHQGMTGNLTSVRQFDDPV